MHRDYQLYELDPALAVEFANTVYEADVEAELELDPELDRAEIVQRRREADLREMARRLPPMMPEGVKRRAVVLLMTMGHRP